MTRLDEYFSELVVRDLNQDLAPIHIYLFSQTSIDVDIMPGEFDPTNHMMPQQPLHPCLLPKVAFSLNSN